MVHADRSQTAQEELQTRVDIAAPEVHQETGEDRSHEAAGVNPDQHPRAIDFVTVSGSRCCRPTGPTLGNPIGHTGRTIDDAVCNKEGDRTEGAPGPPVENQKDAKPPKESGTEEHDRRGDPLSGK